MTYAPKLVLHAPLRDQAALKPFVEVCLADGVNLIAVIGAGSAKVEDLIDELVVGDGSGEGGFIYTTSHPDEPLEDVLNFVRVWPLAEGDGQQVWL